MMSSTTEAVKVWIAPELGADRSQVFVGYVSAGAPLTLRYELVGEKRGPAGHSRVQQGGEVAVAADGSARLSQVSFGRLDETDHYSVNLRVFDGAELVGHAAIDR